MTSGRERTLDDTFRHLLLIRARLPGMHATGMRKPCSLVLVLAASGCLSYANTDPSAGYRMLGVTGAGAESRADATTTANQLTRVFAERGFTLQHERADPASGEIALELWKTRRRVDSVYYAWVRPDGARGSQIWLVGGPVSYVDEQDASYVAPAQPWGIAEDQAAQGAMSELQLAGVVSGGLPPGAVPPTGVADVRLHAHADCEAMRREVANVAARSNDLDKRAEILQTAPRCAT